MVRSTRREGLVTVARLVAEAKREPALLDAALDQARSDGQLE